MLEWLGFATLMTVMVVGVLVFTGGVKISVSFPKRNG